METIKDKAKITHQSPTIQYNDKAKKDLKFNLKTDLDGLIKIMMDNELKKYK